MDDGAPGDDGSTWRLASLTAAGVPTFLDETARQHFADQIRRRHDALQVLAKACLLPAVPDIGGTLMKLQVDVLIEASGLLSNRRTATSTSSEGDGGGQGMSLPHNDASRR